LADTACIEDLVLTMSSLIISATTNCIRNFVSHQHLVVITLSFGALAFIMAFSLAIVSSVFPSASAVIWSHPGVIRDFTVPYPERIIPERIINEGTLLEQLISIMLRHRHDLELSPQQVHDLEELRDKYQREAVRYDADPRIAEMELQGF
jgi:hypothetical protein